MNVCIKNLIRLLAIALIVQGCSYGNPTADLEQYINEIKSRPSGTIEPLPPFRPYEAFVYSAAGLRSPFELPIEVERRVYARSRNDVKPDLNREKEFLEGFDLVDLKMVGTLEKNGTLWALLEDKQGQVHWVTDGNYLGKNHGQITKTADIKIEIIEIVSDGLSGWVERPRVLALSEKE